MSTNEPSPVRPGYQTSEFWTTLLSQVVVLLGVLQVLRPGDVNTLQDALGQCVVGASLFLSNAWVVVNYVRSRTALKQGV